MPRESSRPEVQALLEEARALSGDFDALSAAVAARVGLSQNDLLAMDLISRSDGVTAGLLGERLRLTSGAITGLIDRLEAAGFARRRPDRQDRRRVQVVATAREQRIRRLHTPLSVGLRQVAERYSAEELDLIIGFLRKSRAVLQTSIEDIQQGRS